MRIFSLFLLLSVAAWCPAQWKLQTSPTKNDLLSVSTNGGAVWVSGRNGTVLVSSNDGSDWKTCAVPPEGDALTMPTVQGLNLTTAVLISQGAGESSRIYRTTDGCTTWKKVFTNPEATSSFDALRRITDKQMYVIAEPVNGKFTEYVSQDGGETWFAADDPGLDAKAKESAAHSTLVASGPFLYFAGSSVSGPVLHFTYAKCSAGSQDNCNVAWGRSALGGFADTQINAVATRTQTSQNGESRTTVVIAGKKDDTPVIALTNDNGAHWGVPATLPRGPVTGIAFDPFTQAWVCTGEVGTDISTDGARTWHSVKPEDGSTDEGWNAVAMPYAVGKNGHIGKFVPSVIKR